MSKVTEMVEAQEHRYILQNEAAEHAPSTDDNRPACCKPHKDAQMQLLESSVHPHCECCDVRIEAGACIDEKCATRCSSCNAAPDKK